MPNSWLHEPFLERAADPELVDGGQTALGAFLTLRLIDRFVVGVSEAHGQALAYQTQATRDYLLDLSSQTPEAVHLSEIVRVADAVRTGSHRRVLWPPLQAYAYWLEQELRLAEALDVVETALRLNHGEAAGEETAANLQRGRILRLLGRFDEARQAYEVARVLALAIGDMHSALLGRIGNAIVMRQVGNLPGSEAALRQIVQDAKDASDRDAEARAYHDLGAVLNNKSSREAVHHLFRAFELYEENGNRLRALCDVGEALKRGGHYGLARDAFVVVLQSGPTKQVASTTMILLLELCALMGDRFAFTKWKRELEGIADELPAERQADLNLQLGLGHAAFGHPATAERHLREAIAVANRHGLNEYSFRAAGALAQVQETAASVGSARPGPLEADSTPEFEGIAQKLRALRAG